MISLAHSLAVSRMSIIESDCIMKQRLSKETFFDKGNDSKLQEEYISGTNHYDYLTGLPGITYYFSLEDIGRRKNLENGDHSAIIYFNLHGMKDFNRKYGFSEGDNLILSLSHVLVKHFGLKHCGRFGADHFSAFAKAEGIEETLDAVFREFKEMNGSKALPVMAGIYLDEIEDVNASMACDRAKLASEELKNISHSAYRYFDLKMLEKERRRQYIIDNLDKAIEERWIQVYYQPIFRVVNGQVCEEECLARWIDPEKGMISPAEFIPLLEETGLVYKLDLCMIEQVLEKMNRFASRNLAVVPESVNISRSDFDSCDIVEEIRRRVDEAGIERSKFHIEITESVIGKDFNYIKSQIERFQELGFQVWMDDFGSGYSSLDVLQNIKFDLIKLDMRFIQQYNNNKSGGSAVIITEVMKMIAGLGADTLCEGVETEEQLEFLREVGCNKVQGFYLGKPASEEEIIRRYEAWVRFEMEDPVEREYYSTIGRFNLNDPAAVNKTDSEILAHYMDTIPVVILELGEESAKLMRCNQSGKRFMQHFTDEPVRNIILPFSDHPEFIYEIRQFAKKQEWTRISDKLQDGTEVECFVRWVAENPKNGRRSVAIIILAIAANE